MRTSFRLLAGLLAALVLGCLTVLAQGRSMSIADLIAADDNYTTLRRLLNATPELVALLDDDSAELTFYAPTNAAYNELFSDSMMTVEWYLRHPAEIDIMLRQQIVPVALDVAAQPFLNCSALGTMLANNWLMLDNSGESLEINFDPVDAPAQTASNGLLIPVNHLFPRLRLVPAAGDHSPDGSGSTPLDPRLSGSAALMPAEGDIRAVLQADGRFTRYLQLLDARPDLQARLNSPGLYTLFLPTDETFAAYLDAEGLTLDAFVEAHSSFVDDSIAPGYYTPDLLMTDITFNQPQFCTLQPDGVMRTSDDSAGAYIDEVPLTGDYLVAENAVIYMLEGVRFTQFYG
jgi:uncharacterized surface protein with fasciclin (FAS1) repeats